MSVELEQAADYLRAQAVSRFIDHGPTDQRGAALWDAAAALDPRDHNLLGAPARHRVPPPPERPPVLPNPVARESEPMLPRAWQAAAIAVICFAFALGATLTLVLA